VAIQLLKTTVGGRLRNLEAKFGDLVFHNAAARLKKWLLQLSETTGEREKDTIRLNVRLPHQNLANLIATSRETVSALIGHFQRQGLRIQDHRYIRLLDTDGPTFNKPKNGRYSGINTHASTLRQAQRSAQKTEIFLRL